MSHSLHNLTHCTYIYIYICILSYGDLTPFLGSVWHANWKVQVTFNVTHLKLVILKTLLVVFTASQVAPTQCADFFQRCSMGQNASVKNSANHHNLLVNYHYIISSMEKKHLGMQGVF